MRCCAGSKPKPERGRGFAFLKRGEGGEAFRGKAIDVKEVGRKLGVQFVVEGSDRKIGDRVRGRSVGRRGAWR